MKRITLVWISLVLVCSVQVAQAHWITLTDTEGRDARVEHPAKRVLLGFYFEDFLAIVGPNAFDRVVAISKAAWHDWRNSQWNAYLAAVPRIGELDDVGEVDEGTFSLEKAIAAQPDVVILAAWQFQALGDAVNQLEAAGIPVVVIDYNAQTVEKHVQSTLLIGQIMGTEIRAEKLADNYANAVKEVQRRVQNVAIAKPKKVYVELGNKGPEEIGNSYGEGMWGGVIELAGGLNIAKGKIENWGPLNPEYVLSSNPEAIFVAGSYWVNKDEAMLMGFGVDKTTALKRLSEYTKRPGWDSLTAVKEANVHAVYHGGARTLYDYTFLQYIAKSLYPEVFADIDPLKNHQSYYEEYLPIKADGVFMVDLQ